MKMPCIVCPFVRCVYSGEKETDESQVEGIERGLSSIGSSGAICFTYGPNGYFVVL